MYKWLSLIVGFLYIAFGIFVVAYRYSRIIESNIAYPLGGLLVVYGVFRFVRAIIALRNDD
ncbi:MAG: C4-dicarboxylate ABC transporter [Weeksellaceae bacterium]|nr:C4-dicarboxylate ABC transporter [Weeksellaceae bacterium]